MPGANPNKTTKKPTKRTTEPKRPIAVTSASDWSASPVQEQGIVLELPSGKHVRAARLLNLETLVRSGRIPNPLSTVVQGMMETKKMEFSKEQMDDPEISAQMIDMVDLVVESTLIEPKALRPPRKGLRPMTGAKFEETDEAFNSRLEEFEEIISHPETYNTVGTDRIDIADKVFLFFYSQGGVADLATFRATTQRAMADLSAGNPLPQSSK